MGGCSAPNCSNSTSSGKQLFRFPKDAERREIWAVNCRRDAPPPPHSRLCQDHFEQSQFEEVARSPTGGRKLRPNAIPTLFGLQEPPYPVTARPHFLFPLKPEPVERELGFEEHGYARHTPLPGMMGLMEEQPEEGEEAEEEAAAHRQAHHQHHHHLHCKQRLLRLDRLERGLQGFLREDQVRALSLGRRARRRAVWSAATVVAAGRLRRAVGTRGYEYLRAAGHPLPSYRTLCSRSLEKAKVAAAAAQLGTPCCQEEEEEEEEQHLAELGLGLMGHAPPSAYSPTGVGVGGGGGGVVIGGNNEEDEEDDNLIGVLS
ncbi:hypothetical protein CRUP_019490 [Coryphaenoides rupestris]|nr:hypothetical protein CRUP_019490 [Coryphaenoides rupestris]